MSSKPWWNPFRRTEKRQARSDGWQSALTGIGTTARDKRMSATFAADVVTDVQARDLWRGDDMAARVIETIPREMFREGYELKLDDKEDAEDLCSMLEEMGADQAMVQAKSFERAYGGAAIMPVINDGAGDLRAPLNLDRISKISEFLVFEPRELQPTRYYEDIRYKFGQPELYRLVPITARMTHAMMEIHESRLIIFPGIRVSREQAPGCLDGWGDSVLTRMVNVMRDFGMSWAAAAIMLNDFSQPVFSIEGLAELFATDKDDVVRRRMQAADITRSVLRMMVIDSKEKFERTATPLAGFADMLDRFATRLAAAADMPVTLLMGQSPAGLNATGESDRAFFYDRVSAAQTDVKPQLEQLIRMAMRSLSGPLNGREPETWSVEFRPLWQQSDQERAAARKTQAETDAIYISAQVLSPEEVALARFGGDTYSFETAIDFEARAKLEPEPEPLALAGAAQKMLPAGDPEPEETDAPVSS